MARLFDSKLEFDDKQLIKFLKQHWNELEEELEEEMNDQLIEVETGAKALAPKEEGNLEDSIHKTKAIKTGNSIEGDVKVGGTSTKYAVRMHEDKYNPGDTTKGKPSYKGYTPGRKYLENSIKANEKEFMNSIEKVVRKHMSR